MKKFIFCLHVFFCVQLINAQPTIQWQKTAGGTTGDWAQSIQQTFDGGYIIAGYTSCNNGNVSGNNGIEDFWVVKLNSLGAIQWQKCLGGTNYEEAYSVYQTADSGFVVAGFAVSNDGDVTGNKGSDDFWIVKLSSAGNVQWQKTAGGTGMDDALFIQQTPDGGFIVAGDTQSNDGDVSGNKGGGDCWIVKLSSTGGIQWAKCFGGTGDDTAACIQSTFDGGYVFVGSTLSNDVDVSGNNGNFDYWVVKLNGAGTLQWQKCLGGSDQDIGYSIQQTSDSGYVVAGFSKSTNGDVTGMHGTAGQPDYWVVKLNGTGTIQWQKCLGGSNDDKAYAIRQTADGGYIAAGYTKSNDGDVNGNHTAGLQDYWLAKLNGSGNVQWQKCLGGSNNDWARSVKQTADGGYIVAGFSASGNGDVTGNQGGYDYWIVKLNPSATAVESYPAELWQLYPNPSAGTISISSSSAPANITITNAYGRVVHQSSPDLGTTNVNLSAYGPGVYFVIIRSGDHTYTKKAVVE